MDDQSRTALIVKETGDGRMVDLGPIPIDRWRLSHVTEGTADHAGVADDQQVLARVTPDQVIEYRRDTRTEMIEWFRPRGTAVHRIGVKSLVLGKPLDPSPAAILQAFGRLAEGEAA